jgi:hypothetical protein
MTRQIVKGLAVLLVLLAAIVGCTGQGSPTPLPTSAPPPASPTAAPTPEASVALPTDTPTVLPPTSTPTSAPTPQPSPTAQATRIEFSTGMTYDVVTGELAPGGIARYVLRAQAGQLMEVSISTGEGIQLSVQGADGTVLKSAAGTAFFRGTLPSTQDYLLILTAGDQNVSYTLSVIIPERIQFSVGATSAAVQGELAARGVHYYVVGAQADQLMEVSVSAQEPAQTVIYGVDGTVLKSGMSEGSFFRGVLPSTQDYIIAVSAGDQAVSYAMNVMIARRIEFAPGTVSVVEEGEAGPGQDQAWVLAAGAGQTLKVEVTAPGADVRLVIYGDDGTVLRSGMGQGSTFEGVLPSTQDYIIIVGPADLQTSYQLEVTVV